MSSAAIFHEEGQETAHPVHVGEIADAATFPPVPDQPGAGQNAEVGRHRVLTNPEGVAYFTRRHADLSGLDEQAEYIEPSRLAESGESVESMYFIHKSGFIDI